MRKVTSKFLSLFLAGCMLCGSVSTPVYANPTETVNPEEEPKTENNTEVTDQNAENTPAPEESQPAPEEEIPPVEEEIPEETPEETPEVSIRYTIDPSKFDFSNFSSTIIYNRDQSVYTLSNEEENSPEMKAVAEELDNMEVVAEEGEQPKPLTEEQKQQVLGTYAQYQQIRLDGVNILGVQTPFFLSYNDKKDDLGVLGEMLVLGGVSVDDVRSGKYTFDDLMGMIQNFMYGDSLGMEYYSSDVTSARQEALKAVADSGAQTEMQKLLVLNDWLAHENTFDMPYIMNADPERGQVMTAPEPKQHEHYQDVYDTIYPTYEDSIKAQFEDSMRAGIEAQLRQQFYVESIKGIIKQQEIDNGKTEEEANAAAEAYYTENKEAIDANPVEYVEENFPSEVAEALGTKADEFIADAKQNGVVLDPDKPDEKVTIDEMVAEQMNKPMGENAPDPSMAEMTYNEAVPVFADQAAKGLTQGVLNYWEGSHFGALAGGTSVCLGYSKAYAYIVQWMHPEIYAVDGKDFAGGWKTAEELYYDEEGNLDITKNYAVDCVRITFDASVTMYGETQENFGSDHFWNAVQVDGKWYYVDPCYTDVYVEVMKRDRAETDGNMNHLYFMFSHTTATELYEGYYKEIKTLYENAATDRTYEDAWFSRAKSNVYSDGEYFYYLYDSTDLITMMGNQSFEQEESKYKLVRRAITNTDAGNGDSDYETLIEFNYKASEEDETSVARVNVNGEMQKNDTLTEMYARHTAEEEVYPAIAISTGLYNGKLYFNISNCIFSYDLASGEVVLVKEYNNVSATRDKSQPFGAMAFSVVKGEGELSVKNHPIASMTIKNDGNMYVSVATNYAFISGKDPHNCADNPETKKYGYEFEESNYNPNYSTYGNGQYDDMMEQMGYAKQTNDNDEFMWTANFVDKLAMSHLAATSHTYEEVSVEAYCGRNAYTENRCTECGASEKDSREEIEKTAHEKHHYIHFTEEYYTKAKDGSWNTGDCYVCTECGFSISEPTKPKENGNFGNSSYEEQMEEYEKKKAIYDEAVKIAGHTYVPTDATWSEDSTSVSFTNLECSSVCKDRKNRLDCLLNDETISVTLGESYTASAEITGHEGECTEGVYVIYTASGEVDGHKFTAQNKVQKEAGQHIFTYEPDDLKWEETKNEDGTVTYTAKLAKAICEACGIEKTDLTAVAVKNEEECIAPECEKAGKDVYVATISVKDETEEEKEVGTITCSKEVEVPATGHKFENSVCTVCDKLQFKDVAEDAWYYESVKWAAKNGITTGLTEDTFGKNKISLRADVVTFLWRNAGKPEPTTVENPFKDIKETSYYYKAVLWAVENGITSGLTKDTFGPIKECTRGEIVTFLWRNAGKPEPTIEENPFDDVEDDTYFYKAILWAVENGITSGLTENTFAPFNSCTRSEVVTFLYRQFGAKTEE